MSKAYLLVVCILLSSLTGCVDDDGEVKINENNTSKFTEIPKCDFFYVDDPNLDVLRNGTREFAVGVANLGNYSHEFTVTSNSGIGSAWYTWAFPIYINSSAFEKIPGYSEHLEGHGNQVLGYYHGTTFVLEPNDVQIIIFRTSFIDNAIDRSELEILANTTWHNNSNSLVGETKNLTFVMSATEFGQNGQQVEIGNYTESYYAGIAAESGLMFDTNIDYLWDNYEYRQAGVNNNNRHTSTLSAYNVGCNAENDPSENCDGSKGMIEGFDAGMLGMYVGQTKYVVIPPELAYGEEGSLAGKTLIFSITIVSID